jgi:hypothetical protein
MPADHGLRPDDLQSVQNARFQPIQPGKYQTVDAGEAQSLRRFTSQHVELMTKRQILCLQRRSRPEQSDQRQPNQAANISHQPRASPNSTPLASRIEFPTMTRNLRPSRGCPPREAATENLSASFPNHLMNIDQASGPRMPRIKKLVLRDPVGVPSSCCTIGSERIDP